MNIFQVVTVAFAVTATGVAVCAPASGQVVAVTEVGLVQAQSGTFIKKSKKLRGGWEVVHRGDKTFIVFGDDFRAANGPDLKVFLSPMALADVTGKTAVDGSINIGGLQKTKGAQEYEVPNDVNLTDYASVLVHCEEYAVLWGGGDL